MMWVAIAVVAIILLIIVVLIMKISVIIDYYHGNDDDHLKITLKALFGLLRYKINIPVIKMDKDSPAIVVKENVEMKVGPQENEQKKGKEKFTVDELLASLKDMKLLLKHVAGLHRIIRSFLKKVTVSKVEWNTIVGVGDAAYTGMLTGAIWTVKGSIIGLMCSLMKVQETPQIMITPDFNRSISQTSLKCMIHFRIGHAIFAGIKLFKYWKGDIPQFKTKPLSSIFGNKTKSV
ncbi:DUF2953 domain-containing protein [Robertmurraya kyonggiensis]|uniref:DUF2953 domain-containing protein n=1 Tax=Robertmurraya kyonggiensis TaxID=1037680 RepID=A0A4U1D158_9BACI|nr:DUF2953 domain-containing protein [Robertmurraya kyonggiensis]TKC15804.1 DUF2953 domain-containing protein [Robertmurraya kyonggiensis]